MADTPAHQCTHTHSYIPTRAPMETRPCAQSHVCDLLHVPRTHVNSGRAHMHARRLAGVASHMRTRFAATQTGVCLPSHSRVGPEQHPDTPPVSLPCGRPRVGHSYRYSVPHDSHARPQAHTPSHRASPVAVPLHLACSSHVLRPLLVRPSLRGPGAIWRPSGQRKHPAHPQPRPLSWVPGEG